MNQLITTILEDKKYQPLANHFALQFSMLYERKKSLFGQGLKSYIAHNQYGLSCYREYLDSSSELNYANSEYRKKSIWHTPKDINIYFDDIGMVWDCKVPRLDDLKKAGLPVNTETIHHWSDIHIQIYKKNTPHISIMQTQFTSLVILSKSYNGNEWTIKHTDSCTEKEALKYLKDTRLSKIMNLYQAMDTLFIGQKAEINASNMDSFIACKPKLFTSECLLLSIYSNDNRIEVLNKMLEGGLIPERFYYKPEAFIKSLLKTRQFLSHNKLTYHFLTPDDQQDIIKTFQYYQLQSTLPQKENKHETVRKI